jgi:hypothetical protein
MNALWEMHLALRPQGVIGIGVWGDKNGSTIIWDAACRNRDPIFKSTWLRPEQAEAALSQVGFKVVNPEIFPTSVRNGRCGRVRPLLIRVQESSCGKVQPVERRLGSSEAGCMEKP